MNADFVRSVFFFWYDSTLYFINLDNCDSCFQFHRWIRVHPVRPPLRFIAFSGVDFAANEDFSNYLFRSMPLLPSKTEKLQRIPELRLRLKNISISMIVFHRVVIRFKFVFLTIDFLLRLSIEINEFCSKIFQELRYYTTGWTRLHDSSAWKFTSIRFFLASCFVVNVCVFAFPENDENMRFLYLRYLLS